MSGGGTGGDVGIAGSAGTAGTAGTAGSGSGGGGQGGPYDVPRGMSTGCGKQNAVDEPGTFSKHDIDVTGVDPQYVADHPASQGGYTWTHRNYFIRLPQGYDPSVAYPLVFGGGGCGSTDGMSGSGGGSNPVKGTADQNNVIQVGLSYMWGNGQGACFQDEGVNTPDVPYFDSVYNEITTNNCVDLEKVFIGGYSSGAWLAYTMGLARGGIVRGMAAGAGGIREERWQPPANIPFAMLGITGTDDGANPVHRTKDGTSCAGTEAEGCWGGETICGFPGAEDCFDTGSAAARDFILNLNGCGGSDGPTEQWGEWPECKKYTNCPAAFPVVYCMPVGGHTDGGERFNPGGWDLLWKTLPPVP